jgi:hypothetical protein
MTRLLSIDFHFLNTGSVVASDLQVKIKIVIEDSLLSKLPYETIYILLACNLTFFFFFFFFSV